MHPVIQSAVAAQHVKDMLDHAAEDRRHLEARRARLGRRGRRAGASASSRDASPRAASSPDASSRDASPRAAHSGPAPTQCCPD